VNESWWSVDEWRPATSVTRLADPIQFVFTVMGEPRAKARPRVTRSGYAYTPKTTLEAEKAVRDAFVASGGDMIPGAIGVDIMFLNGTRARKDIDNQAKLVLDALNGVAYADDFQIAVLHLKRDFVSKDEAQTRVRLFQL